MDTNSPITPLFNPKHPSHKSSMTFLTSLQRNSLTNEAPDAKDAISQGRKRSQTCKISNPVTSQPPQAQQVLPHPALNRSQTFPTTPAAITPNKGREALKALNENHNSNGNPLLNIQASVPQDPLCYGKAGTTTTDTSLCLVADTHPCHCRYEDYKRKAYLEWIGIAEGSSSDSGYESCTHGND